MEFYLQQDASKLDEVSSVILPLADATHSNDVLATDSLKNADTILNGAMP